MSVPMVLPIHVAAGGCALVLGAVALTAKKGGWIHRRSGLLFVAAMTIMGIGAAILGNVGGGVITIYFVGTALTTVRPVSAWTRWFNVVALVVVVGLALLTFLGGVEAFKSPGGVRNGVPFPMFFFLGIVMLLAAAGDARILRSGAPRGGPRLARHLWRMCFALFIAAGSFFSIRERVAKVLPEPFTTAPMRFLPILLVFVAMFYWLWKVRRRDRGAAVAAVLAAVIVSFAGAAIGLAAEPVPPGSSLRRIELPGQGAILLPVPNGWEVSGAEQKRPGDPIVVKLGPLSEKSLPYLVILMVQKVPAAADLTSLAKVCKGVEKVRDSMADATTPLHEVRGGSLYGCYFSPAGGKGGKKGQWKYTTHGTTVLEDLLVSFSVYSNRSSDDQLAPAVEMLQGARREPPS